MRHAFSAPIRALSVFLALCCLLASAPVCKAAAPGAPAMSGYARPYIEALTKLVPFACEDYTAPIQRGAFAALVYDVLRQMDPDLLTDTKPSFADTDDLRVGALQQAGLITGKDAARFAPNDVLTREEAAAVFGRAFDRLGFRPLGQAPAFSDQSDIAPWAASAVAVLCPYKIFIGADNGSFRPKDRLTWEQAAVIAQRFLRMRELFELDTPLPDGYRAWQTWSATYIEDQTGRVIFSLPRYFPLEMGRSVEHYDGLRVCPYQDRFLCITSGLDAAHAAQGSTTPGTVVFDLLSGRELLFVPMRKNDSGNFASGFSCLTADGEALVFYHQRQQGSVMGGSGTYVYGVYDIEGNERLPLSHSWQDLYRGGWVSEETEPFAN